MGFQDEGQRGKPFECLKKIIFLIKGHFSLKILQGRQPQFTMRPQWLPSSAQIQQQQQSARDRVRYHQQQPSSAQVLQQQQQHPAWARLDKSSPAWFRLHNNSCSQAFRSCFEIHYFFLVNFFPIF